MLQLIWESQTSQNHCGLVLYRVPEIVTLERLPGVVGLERYERKIRDWWRENQRLLVEKWNISRPANCPIGPLELPPK